MLCSCMQKDHLVYEFMSKSLDSLSEFKFYLNSNMFSWQEFFQINCPDQNSLFKDSFVFFRYRFTLCMKWTDIFSPYLGLGKLVCLHYCTLLWLPHIFVLLTRRCAQKPCNHKKSQVVEVHPQKPNWSKNIFFFAFLLQIFIKNISIYACTSGRWLLIQEVIIDLHWQKLSIGWPFFFSLQLSVCRIENIPE